MLLNEKIRQIGRGKYKNAGVGLLKSFEDRLDYFTSIVELGVEMTSVENGWISSKSRMVNYQGINFYRLLRQS